jgi:hypothetical protein
MQSTSENTTLDIMTTNPDEIASDVFSTIISTEVDSQALQQTLLPLQVFFFILSCVFLIVVIYVLSRSNWAKIFVLEQATEFFTYHPYGSKRMPKDWSKILEKLKTGKESEYKLAIVEADKALDEVLKKNYRGASFEDRLNEVSSTIVPNIEGLRENHKIRNEIVFDPDYGLTLDDAKKMVKIYEKALFELRFT